MDRSSHDLPIFSVSSVVQLARSSTGQSGSGSVLTLDPVAAKTWSLDHPSSGQFITPAPCRRDTTSSGQLPESESRGLINTSPGQLPTPGSATARVCVSKSSGQFSPLGPATVETRRWANASSGQCLSSGQSRVDSHRSDMTSLGQPPVPDPEVVETGIKPRGGLDYHSLLTRLLVKPGLQVVAVDWIFSSLGDISVVGGSRAVLDIVEVTGRACRRASCL